MKGDDFVKRRLDAFGRGDIDALVGDYTDVSVIMTPMGNLTGGAQARQVIAGWLEEFAMPGVTFEVINSNCADNVAHFSWRAETPKTSYRFGNETYILDSDGKVITHIFDGDMAPKS